MLGVTVTTGEELRKWIMKQKRERLDMTVATRLPLSRYRTLEVWCTRSLRKRSELIGIVLDRVLEIYEKEAGDDEPLEFFIRRLHLDRDL
jgi:hypothetical protein